MKTQATLPNEGSVRRLLSGPWIRGQMKLPRINGMRAFRTIGGQEPIPAQISIIS
jgi:hypothetical protein